MLLGGLVLVCVVHRGARAGAHGGWQAVLAAMHNPQVLSLAAAAAYCRGRVHRSRGLVGLRRPGGWGVVAPGKGRCGPQGGVAQRGGGACSPGCDGARGRGVTGGVLRDGFICGRSSCAGGGCAQGEISASIMLAGNGAA